MFGKKKHSLLESELRSETGIVVGRLKTNDAKEILASYYSQFSLEYQKLIIDVTGHRRRDMLMLSNSLVSKTDSFEDVFDRFVLASSRVYRHIFRDHLTSEEQNLFRGISQFGEVRSKRDISHLVDAGLLNMDGCKAQFNGQQLDLIYSELK